MLTRAVATRLLLENQRCVGLEVLYRGARQTFRSNRETVLTAGAIGTPKLLLLSGIGAPGELNHHGIDVVKNLPGVGRNLNDHVNVLLSAHVDRPSYNREARGYRMILNGARFLATGRGPASSPANHVQAFVRSDPAAPVADIQLQFMAFGFGTAAQMRRNGVTAVVSPCRPHARGAVRLRSADPTDPPRINMTMLEAADDRPTLLRGCRIAERALVAGAKGDLYTPAQSPKSDEQWLAFIRANAGINWHPAGTCRMGVDDEAVVDGRLQLHGIDGLSVADASIMPCVTSGNTNATVIAIAERAAAWIKERT